MSRIDDLVTAHWRLRSPAEKLGRVLADADAFRAGMCARARAEHPDWSERDVQIHVARRIYGADPAALRLLALAAARK
ncbi:MAG: hypothetical protein IT353_21795 [Gemmatimonadaceae bacterium]|nr:hypothetical protein [Gemmatimonadaceae bacterium]